MKSMASEIFREYGKVLHSLLYFKKSPITVERIELKCLYNKHYVSIIAFFCEFIVSEKQNMGPVILVSVITHHTPFLM
jgi:hypothetical protein